MAKKIERDDMSDSQRKKLARLAKIHGYKNVHDAMSGVHGVKARHLKRRGYTDIEAASAIQQLSSGTSMEGTNPYGSADKLLCKWSAIIAGITFVLSFGAWWMILFTFLFGGIAAFFAVRVVLSWFNINLWWISREKRRERIDGSSLFD